MKKMILFALAAVCTGGAYAQKIGVHAAALLSSQTISTSGISLNASSRVGWKAGLVGEVKLGGGFRFMPQLNVVSKGSKFNVQFFGQGVESKTSLTYLELPLNVTYNTPIGLFFGVGPSLSVGIDGKETTTADGQTETNKIKFGGTSDPNDATTRYRRIDFGGQVLAGYHLPKGFFLNAHYSFGLSNAAITDEDGTKVKNHYFGFGVGKFFGR